MMTFWISFLVAFLVLTAVLTPVMAAVSDFRPFGGVIADEDGDGEPDGEMVILEEAFDYFIPNTSPFYQAFTEAKRVNCLLLGVKSGLTDTIMLVSFDTQARHVDIISIPRDTFYHRKGYNGDAEDKINAAYRKDPLNSAIAVSDVLMGMPINYYAVIEYQGVEKIVDSIGGVTVDIPFDMKYSDPYDKPPLYINLKKGVQILNGEDAVKFLRYRKGYIDADLGRVKAQQEFMKEAFKQALKSNLPQLAATIRENVMSDIPMSMMLYLAQKVTGMPADSISTYTMPGRADPNPPYYVYPTTLKIEEMIREIYLLQSETETEAEDETAAVNTNGE